MCVCVRVQVSVPEPENSATTIDLTVTRTGSFGTATITWTISPSSSTPGAEITDIGANAGIVIIPTGSNTAAFQFTILPDDIPEIDEGFMVTLLQVSEPNQMILPQEVH